MTRDLVGVGIGPANLSLAALAQPLPGLTPVFLEQRTRFAWHPGMLIDGATLQVPFMADLVTLVDPASPWTFLNHLRSRDRLFPFYFAERFHVERAEYDAYCRWVCEGLGDTLWFGHRVDAVRWNAGQELFEVEYTRVADDGRAGGHGRLETRNVVVGVGTEPHVPSALRQLADDPDIPVIHSADYLRHRDTLLAAGHVTVVGAGQSGAEVFLDLLRARPAGRERLRWITRTGAFAPMEYSKLGLEHFTPDYTRYFHGLNEPVRGRLLAGQWQLYKGIGADTIAAVHEELYARSLGGGWPDVVLTPAVRLHSAARAGQDPDEDPDHGPDRAHHLELAVEHLQQGTRTRLRTDAVVLATGYRERPLDGLLGALDPYLRRDATGRPQVDTRYRLVLDPAVTGTVHVQNAERHTHGVGAPDLGLTAWRSATIINSLTGTDRYPLPSRTAFTTFGLQLSERPERPELRFSLPQPRPFQGGGSEERPPLVDELS